MTEIYVRSNCSKRIQTIHITLFVYGPQVAKNFHSQVAGKFVLQFRHLLQLELIVNIHVTLYWFFIQIFYIVSMQAAIKKLS